MRDLSGVSVEELEAELERRTKSKQLKPVLLPTPDVAKLRKLCVGYIETLAEGDGTREDADHYIFEAAMEAFYGESVWDYVNEMEA